MLIYMITAIIIVILLATFDIGVKETIKRLLYKKVYSNQTSKNARKQQ